MRTYKLIGSGPLAGLVAYGTIKHIDFGSDDGVVLDIGDKFSFAGYTFSTVTISAVTGAYQHGKSIGQSDIVTLDPADLPRLNEAYTIWMGVLPS